MVDRTALLYRPNFWEIKTIKATDTTNRRKLRLLQVRRISRSFSAQTRYLYQKKRFTCLKEEALKLQRDQLHNEIFLLKTKQNAFDGIVDVIGDGHKAASTSIDFGLDCEKSSSASKSVSMRRFRKALCQLLESRAESMKETELRRLFRETAHATERQRAQLIASLPLNPPDPLEAHLGFKSDTCSLCPPTKTEHHLVVTANDPLLSSEEAKESDEPEVLGVAVVSEALKCDTGVIRTSDPATVDVNSDAFYTALLENLQSEEVFREKQRQAIETSLKAQLRGQIAFKVNCSVQDNYVIRDDLDVSPPSNEVHPKQNICPATNGLALLGPGERADLPPLLEISNTRPLSRLKTDVSRLNVMPISTNTRCQWDLNTRVQDVDLNESNGSICSGISEVNHGSCSSSSEDVSSYERLKMQLDSELEVFEREIAHLRGSCRLGSVSNLLAQEKKVVHLSLFPGVMHIRSPPFPSGSIDESKHRDSGTPKFEPHPTGLADNVAAKANVAMEKSYPSDSARMDTLPQRAHPKSKEIGFDEVAIGTSQVMEDVRKLKAYRLQVRGKSDKPTTVGAPEALEKKPVLISALLRRRAQELIKRQTEHVSLLENSEQSAGGDGAYYLTSQELPGIGPESSRPSAKPDDITLLTLDSLKVNSCKSWPHLERGALDVGKASSLSFPLPSLQLSMSSTSVNDIDSTLVAISPTTMSLSKSFLNGEETPHSPQQNPVVFEQSARGDHIEHSLSITDNTMSRKPKLLRYYLKHLLGSLNVVERSKSNGVLQDSLHCLNQSNNNFVSLASPSLRGNNSEFAYLHEPKEGASLISRKDSSSLSSSNRHKDLSSSTPESLSGIFAYGKTAGQFRKLPCEGDPSNCDLELSSSSSQSLKRKIAVIKSAGSNGILTQKHTEIAPAPQKRKTAILVSETVTTVSQPTSSPSSNQAEQVDKSVTENEDETKATSRHWHKESTANSSTSLQHSKASNSSVVLTNATSSPSSPYNLLPSVNQRRTWVVKGKYHLRSMTDESHSSQVTMSVSTRVDSTRNSSSRLSNQFSSLSSTSLMVLEPRGASESSKETVNAVHSSGNDLSSPKAVSAISASAILLPSLVDRFSHLSSSNSAPPSSSMKRKIFDSRATDMNKASLDAQANSGSTLSRLQTNSVSSNPPSSSCERRSAILSRFNKQHLSKSLTMVNASKNSQQATGDNASIPIFYSTTNYCNATGVDALAKSGIDSVTEEQSPPNEGVFSTVQRGLSRRSLRQIWFKEQKYNLHLMSTESDKSPNVEVVLSNSSPHSDSTPNSSSRPSKHFTSLSPGSLSSRSKHESSVKKPTRRKDTSGMRSSRDGTTPSQTTSAFGSELLEDGITQLYSSEPSLYWINSSRGQPLLSDARESRLPLSRLKLYSLSSSKTLNPFENEYTLKVNSLEIHQSKSLPSAKSFRSPDGKPFYYSMTNYCQFAERNAPLVNGLSVVRKTQPNQYAVPKISDKVSTLSPNISGHHQTSSVALEVYSGAVGQNLTSDSPPSVDEDCIWFQKINAVIAPLDESPHNQVCLSSSTQTSITANTSSRPSNHFSNLSSASLASPLHSDRDLSGRPLRSSEDHSLSTDFIVPRNELLAEDVSPLNPAEPISHQFSIDLVSQIKSEESGLDKASLGVQVNSGSTLSRLQSNIVSSNPSSGSNEKFTSLNKLNKQGPIVYTTSESSKRSIGCIVTGCDLSSVEEDIASRINGNTLWSVEDSSNLSISAAQDRLWFQKTKFRLRDLATGLEDSPNVQEGWSSSTQTYSTPNTSSDPENHFSSLSSASPLIASERGSTPGTRAQPLRADIPSSEDCPNTKAIVALCNELLSDGVTSLSSVELSPPLESNKSTLSNPIPLNSSFGDSGTKSMQYNEIIQSKSLPVVEQVIDNNRSNSVEIPFNYQMMKSCGKESLTEGFGRLFVEANSESNEPRSFSDSIPNAPGSSRLYDGLAIKTIICRVDPTKSQHTGAGILQGGDSNHEYNPALCSVNTHGNTNASNNTKKDRGCGCSKRSSHELECDEYKFPSPSASCTSLPTFLRSGPTCEQVATCQGQQLTFHRFHMTNDHTYGSTKLQQFAMNCAPTNMHRKQTQYELERRFQSGQDNTISSRPFDPTSSDTFCGAVRNQTYFDDLSGGIYVRDPYVCRSQSADNVAHCHCTRSRLSGNATIENSPRARTGVGWNPNVPYASPEEIYCRPRQCRCAWMENDLFSWPMTSRAHRDGKKGTELISTYTKTTRGGRTNMGRASTRIVLGGAPVESSYRCENVIAEEKRFAEQPGDSRSLASKAASQKALNKSETLVQAEVDVNAQPLVASHSMKYRSANGYDAEKEVFTASERKELSAVDAVTPAHSKGSRGGSENPTDSDSDTNYAVPVVFAPKNKYSDGGLKPLDKQGEHTFPVKHLAGESDSAKYRKQDLNANENIAGLFGLGKDLKPPSDTVTDFTETFVSKSPTITQENASKAHSPETSFGKSKEHSFTPKSLDPGNTDGDLKSQSMARSLGVKAVVELPQSSSKRGIGNHTSLVEISATIGVPQPYPADASKEESARLKFTEMKRGTKAPSQSPPTPLKINSSADPNPVDQAKRVASASDKEDYESTKELSKKGRLKGFSGEGGSRPASALDESSNPDFKIGEALVKKVTPVSDKQFSGSLKDLSKKGRFKGVSGEGGSRPASALDESSIPEASVKKVAPISIKQISESARDPSKEEVFKGVGGEAVSRRNSALDEPSMPAFKIGGASAKKSSPGGKKTATKKVLGIKNDLKPKPPKESSAEKERKGVPSILGDEDGQELPQFLVLNTAANVARMGKVKGDLEKTELKKAQEVEVEVSERNVAKNESDDSSSEQMSEGLFGLSLKSWKQKSKSASSLVRPLTPQHRFKKAASHIPKKRQQEQHQQVTSREKDSIPDASSTVERRWRPRKMIEMEERISSNFPFGRFQIRTPERKRSKSRNSSPKRRKKPSRSPTTKPS